MERHSHRVSFHKICARLYRIGEVYVVVLAARKALLRGKIPEVELNRQRLTIAKALIHSKKYDHEKISRFLYFLKQFIYIENKEINHNFNEQINLLTNNRNTMGILDAIKEIGREEGIEKGIEKGIEQGIERGKAIVVANLLKTKQFTVAEIANFASVSENFVLEMKVKLEK